MISRSEQMDLVSKLERHLIELVKELKTLRERFEAHVKDEAGELEGVHSNLRALHDKVSEVRTEIDQVDGMYNNLHHLSVRMEHMEKALNTVRREGVLSDAAYEEMAGDVTHVRQKMTELLLRGASALQKKDKD